MLISYIIIGLTVVVSMAAFNNPTLMRKLIMNPYMVHHHKQYYRFITSGFIHQDHMHLIFNMISFYFFGTITEQLFGYVFADLGGLHFIALYILAIGISDMPSFFKHKLNPAYNSLGASGGVSAVIFAFILFLPTEKICLYFALCVPGFILGGLYLVYSYWQGKKSSDNINHDAHLYGALFGLLFCIVLYPASVSLFIKQLADWRWDLF
ncbi:MAG TPA: rhomboid family intramembrane serine protease [Ohtaekwangia sp.]|nr:rhomboid family intramembrane serine protease [Ohtaekwangia sp.]